MRTLWAMKRATRPSGLVADLLQLRTRWLEHDMGNVAGALTFFALLALFPFLLFLVALFGWLLEPREVSSLVASIDQVMPEAVATILGQRIQALAVARHAGLMTASAAGAVFSASGGVVALMNALNTAYGRRETRPFLRRRLLALGMTLSTALLALVAGFGAIALPSLAQAIGTDLVRTLSWLRLPMAGLVMALQWALLYWALPDHDERFRLLPPGSIVCVPLWLAASWAFSQYVAHFGRFEVTYGALGGFVILLTWMWITSQALLLGAEINALRSGDRAALAARPEPRRTHTPARRSGLVASLGPRLLLRSVRRHAP